LAHYPSESSQQITIRVNIHNCQLFPFCVLARSRCAWRCSTFLRRLTAWWLLAASCIGCTTIRVYSAGEVNISREAGALVLKFDPAHMVTIETRGIGLVPLVTGAAFGLASESVHLVDASSARDISCISWPSAAPPSCYSRIVRQPSVTTNDPR
jgi:hypothetical protein